MENEILIRCPHCGTELFDEEGELPIPASQVTLTLAVVGDLNILCPSCKREVGGYVASVLNGYARLAQDLLPLSNQPYRLLRNLVKTINSLIPLPRSTMKERGKLSRETALKLRYGLADGKQRTLKEVGDEVDLTKERVRQILVRAGRMLRHPSRSKLIHQAFWQMPDVVESLRSRLDQAETELARSRTTVDDLTKELEKRTLDLAALTDRLIQQGAIAGDILDRRLDQLGLQTRTFNALNRSGLNRLRQVLTKSPFELTTVRNFGTGSFRDLVEKITKLGVDVTVFWGEDYEKWL